MSNIIKKTTLASANKIILSPIILEEVEATSGDVLPSDSATGLSKVTISGAGGILSAVHSYANEVHTFTIGDDNIIFENLSHFIIQPSGTFQANYTAGDTITIIAQDGIQKVSELKCYNIYNPTNEQSLNQEAVTGSFKEGESDLIEIYFNTNSNPVTGIAAVINPRVAIWTN